MASMVLIALIAGAAAALLVSSLVSGSFVSILLFCLARLPILLATLGWPHITGLAAAVFGAMALAIIFNLTFALGFLAAVGLPAWWLGYLAMMGRQDDPAGPMEWYPPGRLVFWSAILGSLVVIIFAISKFGFDGEAFYAELRKDLEALIRTQSGSSGRDVPLPRSERASAALDVIVRTIPAAAGLFATWVNILNIWLAGRIVQISGRLRRPWPDLAAMELPAGTPALFVIALVAILLPGFVGMVGSVLAASLAMAYVVLGFAILHGITRGMRARRAILAGAYLSTGVLGWPMLGLLALGLLDSVLHLRRRATRAPGPGGGPDRRS